MLNKRYIATFARKTLIKKLNIFLDNTFRYIYFYI